MAQPARPDAADAGLRAAHEAVQDALLVERIRHGDAAAYDALVRRHMRRAFSIAYRILEQREDAEDVVQDSFIRALERFDTLQHGRPFRPWFHRIVLNQALNYRRGRALRATDEIPAGSASAEPSPAATAEHAMLRDRLRVAMAALPERQRTIVQLAELEDFTSPEIAELLGIVEGTVRWHLHQARQTLRAALAPLKEET